MMYYRSPPSSATTQPVASTPRSAATNYTNSTKEIRGIRVIRGQFFGARCLRARAEINSHFGASAGRADARRHDEVDVGHRRGAATKPIRALRRRAPSGLRPAGPLALLLAPHIPPRV